MYITAMWLRSARKERGINIYVHRHPDGLPENPWRVANDPGPEARELRRQEIRPGGNYVEAYIDMVLADDDYSVDRVTNALDQMANVIADGAPNPVIQEFGAEGGPTVRIRFSISNLIADPETTRHIYELLRATLVDHLSRNVNTLPDPALRQRARRASG
jgi:hypothetical protein